MPELTAQRARELLSYDAETGLLTWRVDRKGKFARRGNEAGSVNTEGHVLVGIDGQQYSAARLIHLMVKGAWPTGNMKFDDHDPQNLRWSNLVDPLDGRSMSAKARYYRNLRLLNKAVTDFIASSPELFNQYQFDSDATEQRRIRADLRAYITFATAGGMDPKDQSTMDRWNATQKYEKDHNQK